MCRQTNARLQILFQFFAQFVVDQRRVDQTLRMQMDLLEIGFWRFHILHVAIGHQFGENT